MKESILKKHIKLAVSKCGALVLDNPTGRFISPATGRVVTIGSKGAADLILCAGGQFIALEVKTEKGVQSDIQKKWQAALEKVGGTYAIVRSPDQAVAIINEAKNIN